MSESAQDRITRLFPTFHVTRTDDGVRVTAHGHVCWISADMLLGLDDMDVSYVVTSLLFPPEVTS